MKHYDVVIIGRRPSGIFTALELYKHAPETLRVLVVDEGINMSTGAAPRVNMACACAAILATL